MLKLILKFHLVNFFVWDIQLNVLCFSSGIFANGLVQQVEAIAVLKL